MEDELEAFIDEDRLEKSTAIRKLFADGLEEWRTERALERLENGDVTFSKAAELAGVDTWELARLARERDITWGDDDHQSGLDDL